jgi:hypothetical protein
MILSRKHREIEKRHGCRRGSLKGAVKYLQNQKANLAEIEKGCEEWCLVNGDPNSKISSFEIAFNLYVSALKNPKK